MTHFKIDTPISVKIKQQLWLIKSQAFHKTKRILDIALSLLAIVILSPLLILTALLIRLESSGNVLFKQQRIGLNGIPFTILKFRSMFDNADQNRTKLESQNEMSNGVIFKIKQDPRITRVGRIIRKTSIDELPQLFNVLIGNMSLVGPRPPLANEVAQYSSHDRIRLDVLPGITCLWQVSGRSDVPFNEQVQLDIEYIEKQSIGLDLILLLRTIPAVIKGNGAY